MWTRRQALEGGLFAAALPLLPRPAFAATDELRIGLAAEPAHLDPTALGADAATLAISYQNIFEGLTRIDAAGQVQPGLAKSWTVAPDGLGLSFALHDDARYHDGTSFDADHVVFALTRLLAPANGNPRRQLFDALGSVTATDAATVALHLKRRDEALLFNLGRPEAVIVAPESADNNRTVPIGTGPFAFVQWDARQRVLLERNEDYYGPHPRMIDVNFTFIPDAAAAVAALLAGQIDGYPVAPGADVLTPLTGNAAFRVVAGKGRDGGPRVGAWSTKLDGVVADAPLGGCALADLRWAGEAAPEAPAPAALPDDSSSD